MALNLPDVPEQLNRTVKDLCHQSSSRGPDRYVGFEFGVIETGLSLS